MKAAASETMGFDHATLNPEASLQEDRLVDLPGNSDKYSDHSLRSLCRNINISVIDLFAGAGGLSEGFRQAGCNIVCGTDSDPDALSTYCHNFPRARTICGDIRKHEVRESLIDYGKTANIVVGGPPCQAFSQVRNHERIIDDPRNSLYREFVNILSQLTPEAFVMENVTGIDQMNVREQISKDLALDGHYLVLPQVLDSSDFGVPQSRKRLIFVGVRNDLQIAPPVIETQNISGMISLSRSHIHGCPSYHIDSPLTLFSESHLQALNDPNDLSFVTASQALSDLEILQAGNRRDSISYAELPAPSSAYQRLMRMADCAELKNLSVPRINQDTAMRLENIPSGGNYRDLPIDLTVRYISGQKWGQDNGSGKLSRKHFYAYRRLHPLIWAWTLNTKADSVYHYKHPRALSVREFARLQSFPDHFVFTTDKRKGFLPGRHDGGAAHSKYRQVGNAVPPLMARAIALRLLVAISPRSALPVAA
jgi:DNA (cytosine-5)-methyltransferase 1